jgi:hypothetical protein
MLAVGAPGLVGAIAHIRGRPAPPAARGVPAIATAAIAIIIVFRGAELVGFGHQPYDRNQVALARVIAERIPSPMPVIAYRVNEWVLVYYADRPIAEARGDDDLHALTQAVEQSPGRQAAVILRTRDLKSVRSQLDITEIQTIRACEEGHDWALVLAHGTASTR